MTEPTFTNWRKSTKSSGGGNCVEVAHAGPAVGVRDTKNRNGGTLVFSAKGWGSFLAGLREGKFALR
ncbi:DUF397 domain-containing protein [Micromonospora fulviviridis]|uniref:DUF397 domain-containing protein n=1 Tax=Micromonospora fulviviridis TaxID=47860 RepID=UPI0037AEEFF0